MYSTTYSIMFQSQRMNHMHPLYPFLEELLFITTQNYLDNSNVGWVGVMGGTFLPDSESEEEDEEDYALYPDSDEHDDCYCIECERKIDIYEPPFTRLQARNKQTLLDITNKIIESYKERSYYMFEYMEEQKHYTEWEVEQKFDEHDVYITEQDYRDICESIQIGYEEETKCLKTKPCVADRKKALVSLDIEHPEDIACELLYDQMFSLKTLLENEIPEVIFDETYELESRKIIRRIYVPLETKFSIHNKNTWRDCYEFYVETMTQFELFFYEYEDFIRAAI